MTHPPKRRRVVLHDLSASAGGSFIATCGIRNAEFGTSSARAVTCKRCRKLLERKRKVGRP